MTTQELAYEVISRLKKEYPDADCTLDYDDAWKLLVSVRLAAQCTDARALVKKPEILILDDSASALDFATDAALRKSLHQLGGNTTTFLVSQRAASIRQADLILVLDDGQLAGKGTHQELISTCETYREIFFSQFPEERTKYEKATGKEVLA